MEHLNGEQPLPNENEPVKTEHSIARQVKISENVETDTAYQDNVGEIVEKETEDSPSVDGSPIGKFKSVDALYSAYNNLQAEFTKKCQKLSELQKEIESKIVNSDITEISNDKLPQSSVEVVTPPKNETYDYLSDTWDIEVNEFLKANPEARAKAEAICNEKINDPLLTLKQAYDRVLAKEYKEPNKLAEDDTFLNEYIYNSEKIKQRVLQDYFSSLEVGPTPFLMGKGANAVTANQPKVAGSLDEAGKMAVSLFR